MEFIFYFLLFLPLHISLLFFFRYVMLCIVWSCVDVIVIVMHEVNQKKKN